MTTVRTAAGINKTEDDGATHGQIMSALALQPALPTTVVSAISIVAVDLPGGPVRPKFRNI